LAKSATLRPFDAIFTRMGAADDLASGKSTFLCELERASFAVNRATPKSLVILDELGRGTSTFDGVAIAAAVLEHLVVRVRSTTVFVTHYHELAEAAARDHPNLVRNAHMAFERSKRVRTDQTAEEEEDDILMLYKLEDGLAPESFGLHAARVAGLPRAVLELAQATRAKLQEI
jgi:DNA mismatch repair ATPase MutS